MLKYAKKHSIDENERLKILANTSLCEAKYKGRIYHIEYRNAILVLFPEVFSIQHYFDYSDRRSYQKIIKIIIYCLKKMRIKKNLKI